MSNVYGQTLLDDMVRSQALPMPLVKQAAQEILAVIRQGLIQDGVVNVSNFGTFRLKLAAARKGFNPQTKERITIPAHQRVIFSPCKALRELIQPVHQPAIPIKAEEKPLRAAAKSAPIAPSPPVATKRIIPPATAVTQQPVEPRATSPVPPVQELEQARDIAAEYPAISEQPAAESVDEPQVTTPHLDEVAAQIDELQENTAELSLEVEDETAPQAKPYKYFALGAAAIIVIAAVTASLYYGSATNEASSPQAIVASGPVTKQAAPMGAQTVPLATAPESPSITESVSPEEPLAPLEPAAAEPEELDYSTLYTEMVNAQPESEPLPEAGVTTTTLSTEEIIPETAAEPPITQAIPAGTEPATATTTRPKHFFFSEKTHTIAEGESLWRLAKKHYQNPLLWPHIYQANAAIIDNPDSLRPGRTITLPSLQGSADNLSKTDRRNIAEGYYLTYLHYKSTGHKDAFFALLEAKRYDNKVVEEHRSLLQLSKVEEIMLGHQETMPF